MLPENVLLIYGNYEKSFGRGSARSCNQQVSLRSDKLLHRSISTATRQLEVCLPDYVLFMLLFSVIAFLHERKQLRRYIKHFVSKVVSGFASVCLLQKILIWSKMYFCFFFVLLNTAQIDDIKKKIHLCLAVFAQNHQIYFIPIERH